MLSIQIRDYQYSVLLNLRKQNPRFETVNFRLIIPGGKIIIKILSSKDIGFIKQQVALLNRNNEKFYPESGYHIHQQTSKLLFGLKERMRTYLIHQQY